MVLIATSSSHAELAHATLLVRDYTLSLTSSQSTLNALSNLHLLSQVGAERDQVAVLWHVLFFAPTSEYPSLQT